MGNVYFIHYAYRFKLIFTILCNIWVPFYPVSLSNSWILMVMKIEYRFFTFPKSLVILCPILSSCYARWTCRYTHLRVHHCTDQNCSIEEDFLHVVDVHFFEFLDLFTVIKLVTSYPWWLLRGWHINNLVDDLMVHSYSCRSKFTPDLW